MFLLKSWLSNIIALLPLHIVIVYSLVIIVKVYKRLDK